MKTAKATLLKLINSDTSKWETCVARTQYFINNKVTSLHMSTPFSLFFARAPSAMGMPTNPNIRTMLVEALQARADFMHSIVFPTVATIAAAFQARMALWFKQKFAHSIKEDPFPDGAYVMTVPSARNSKKKARYKGPFRVVERTRGGSYRLTDETGALLQRSYAPSQMKLISRDPETVTDAYEVKTILASRTVQGVQEYLVEWKGNAADQNTWVPYANFQDVDIVRQ